MHLLSSLLWLLVPLLLSTPSFGSMEVLDLGSLSWMLADESQAVVVPGAVPSDVHLDLYAAQVIGNPYYGQNDVNLRWVAYDNWTYSTVLPDIATWSSFDEVYLVFNGLDTFATITLGNTTLGSADNQWRQWVYDVGSVLQSINAESGSPTLTVAFTSAIVQANYLASLPGQEIFPNASISWFEFGNRMYIRKEQCDFGWDWGPAFATQGIWRPAYLVGLTSIAETATVPASTSGYDELTTDDAFNFTTEVYANPTSLYIMNNDIDIYRLEQTNNLPPDQTAPWVVNVSLDVFPASTVDENPLWMMIDIEGVQNSGWLSTTVTNSTSVTAAMIVPNTSVELWWPYNLGTPKLYNLTATLSADTVNTLSTFTAAVGFRTIVLNMEPVLPNNTLGIIPGNNFHFEINGYEMYSKGSNWIPPDAFWPRVTEERYRQLLGSVVAGNQNVLRVWAGGSYMDDLFYDIADEMGILLWSEFQFSDTPYPVDPAFLANVAVEVQENARRINRHPSLALWAGNNELETYSYASAEAAIPSNASLYMSQFELLFLDTIHPIVTSNSKSISWISASTTNGYLQLNPWVQRYQNVTPGYIYGDEELYDYDPTVSFNSRVYPVSRFVNEFGFHSMPSIYSWRDVLNPADLYFNSTTILTREHHNPPDGLSRIGTGAYAGQGQMTMAVELYYPVPNVTDSVATFASWCWSTQVFQAQFMAAEIQFYRRGSGLPNRNMGALYWQLEDIWVGPTWAGIEYSGRWKVLHYIARNVYSPVIISPFYGNASLGIWATSDQLQPVTGTATWTWYGWSGKSLTAATYQNFTIGAVNSTMLYMSGNGTTTPLFPSEITDVNNALLMLSLQATSSDGKTTFTHENWFSPAYLNTAYLQDPMIELTMTSSSPPTFTVSAKGGVAALTFLEHPEGVLGYFDDNAFMLLPGQDRTLQFNVFSDTTGGAWVDGVTVRSMWNNTHL